MHAKTRLRKQAKIACYFSMTKLAEIQEAITHLPRTERDQLLYWLTDEESPEMLAAIDEADRSFAAEGGVQPEEIRRKLKSWITR